MNDYSLIFYGSWCDYEEDGWLLVCEKDGKLYLQTGGYAVLNPNNEFDWHPELIENQDELLELMLEWADLEDTNYYSKISEIFAEK